MHANCSAASVCIAYTQQLPIFSLFWCAGEATGAHAPPVSHIRKSIGYAWSALRAIRPELAAVAGPITGVALLLAVRMIGLQVLLPPPIKITSAQQRFD